MTIHTPEEVVGIADQMAFVTEGRVIATGAPDAVLHGSGDPRIAAFCGSA
jgi:thiamine transport system ATP-binding protein